MAIYVGKYIQEIYSSLQHWSQMALIKDAAQSISDYVNWHYCVDLDWLTETFPHLPVKLVYMAFDMSTSGP